MTYLQVRNVEKLDYRENFNDASEKSVRIMEVIELQRFELWKAKYKSFLRKFHDDFAFDRITEIRIREIVLYEVHKKAPC